MYILHVLVLVTAPLAVTARLSLSSRQTVNTVTVNLAQTYQKMDGFGFSEAFQRSNQLYNLSPKDRLAVIDLLFNSTSGAGMSILRNGIGSSPDSSSDHMGSIEPKSPGSPSAVPQYVWDGNDNSQVWLSQQAVAYGVKYIYANAWSAPGFMKTNGNDANGGSLCGVTGASCSSGDWQQAFANYLVQYIKYYQAAGVNITHLGFLNEPDLSTSYASMQSTGQQAADFIKTLSPTLAVSNLSSVRITCCDATGWSAQSAMLPGLASVDSLISTITAHAYTSAPNSPLNTKHSVWQTEYADLSGAWTTAWYGNGGAGDGLTWANNIYNGVVKANCSGYLYWIATQRYNQNGQVNEKLISINADNSYTVSKRLWAFAQWSRFVRPDATRVGTTASIASVVTSAFRNVDGSVAVQVINNGASAVSVAVKGVATTGGSASGWVTDNTRDMGVLTVTRGADGTVSGVVPARAMVSFVIA